MAKKLKEQKPSCDKCGKEVDNAKQLIDYYGENLCGQCVQEERNTEQQNKDFNNE